MSTHLEVRLYTGNEFSGFREDYKLVQLYRVGQMPEGQEFQTVDEYDGIMIEFLCDDPTAKLYVDHFIKDEEVELSSGAKEVLVPLKNSEINPSPAYYGIRVQCEDGLYETLYMVKGKHLDWSHIRSMRNFLESRVSGIAYDLLRKRSGMWDGENASGTEWFNTYKRLIKHASSLRHQLEKILEDPLESIQRVYTQTVTSKRPDRVSQRWLEKRGMTRSLHEAAQFYESRITLSLDNRENAWLISFLYDVRRKVKDVLSRFMDADHLKENVLQGFKQRIEEQEREVNRLNSLSVAYTIKKQVQAAQERLNGMRKDYQKGKSELEAFQKSKLDLERIYAYLSRVLTESWISTLRRPVIPVSPSLRLQKDPRYGALLKIKRILAENARRESSSRKYVYPYRTTEKLLEVYIVCLLCQMLQDLNWNWNDGWIGGFDSEVPTFRELHSGEELIFHKDGYQLTLTYEPKLDRIVQQDHTGFEGTDHNSPDILLSIFDRKGQFLKAMVVEVKHRHYRYLIHPVQTTDVMEQLKGYTHIRYHSGGRKIVREAIDRVLCVYPKQERGQPYEIQYGNMIRFIQIQPCPNSEDTPVGYNYLRDEIIDFCRNHAPEVIAVSSSL
jgi:hypothetical protein